MANESFTRQCLRCQAFYENENEQCRYHSHKYVENTHSIREGALTGWPCCRYSKASLVNEKAFHRDYPGCQVAGQYNSTTIFFSHKKFLFGLRESIYYR